MRTAELVHVAPKTVHRMTALEDSDILEVSTPELDDVVRLEDRYGRVEIRPALRAGKATGRRLYVRIESPV